MWSYTLLSLLLSTFLGLVLTQPTELSSLQNEAEEYEPEGFNNNDDDSIIPQQPSFIQVNSVGKTYRIYFTDVNWFTAMEFCSYYGQNLASISSQSDKLQMIATLRQYGVQYSSNSFWLGGSDLGHHGQWVWLTNGVSVEHFANWSSDSPNVNDHCMAVLSTGQWINADCNEKRKFVCESL